MKNLIKHPAVVLSIVGIVAAIVGFYAYTSFTAHPHYDVLSVSTRDMVEQVSVIGQVNAAQNIDMSFERAGTVSAVYHDVGDTVYTGQAIAALNAQDALADVAQAKAALESVQAQAGLQATQQVNTKTAVDDAQKALIDKIDNGYSAADDAIHTQTDQLFTNPTLQNPALVFLIPDQQLTSDLQNNRVALEILLSDWKTEKNALVIGDGVSLAANNAEQHLNSVESFLDMMIVALNKAIANQSVSTTMLDGWKLSVTAARSEVTGALTGLLAAETQLSSVQSAYTLAQQQGATVSDSHSLVQAQIDQATAVLDKAQSALDKTVIRAPFTGVISHMDAKVGQAVNAGVPVIGLLSVNKYQIEGYVSEADIAKLAVNDQADVTLDAYGNGTSFAATVVTLDPSDTVKNGVSSYKVTLQFNTADPRIKSGMTANVNIITAQKKAVVSVPSSALIRQGTSTTVLVVTSTPDKPVSREVTTGITGADGSVEITSGLQVGEEIVGLGQNNR